MPDYTITELNISWTGLINLPDDIDKYTNLEKLYCNYNKITRLDNLPTNLEKLYCYGNPLKYDFEPTLENIRNYNASRMLSSNT